MKVCISAKGATRCANPFGNIAAPPQGYIWDFAKRANVSYRSYGEFGAWAAKGGEVAATVPGLEGLVHPAYPPFDLSIPDGKRVDIWLEEFKKFEQNGTVPRLSIIRLGNDHTSGTSPGMPSPRSMVAENDLALGRLVEAISHSRYLEANPRSSCWRTTRRMDRITWTPIGRSCWR